MRFMKEDLKRGLQKTLVEILDYFVSVCDEYKLQYFLVYGTALGAYRHQGFIPWDDDLDVAMPREDYKKLIEILKNSSNENFRLQFHENEPNWYLTFSKIRKNNTVFIESIADNIFKNNGIYIDVFPLDYVNDSRKISYRIKVGIINYLRHGLKFLSCTNLYRSKESNVRFVLDSIISFPLKLFSKCRILNLLERICIGKHNKETAKYISEYDDPNAISVPIEYYFPPRLHEFEGKSYYVPGKIENYLEYVYGPTYMQLPPIEDRQTHQPIEIQF